MVNTLILDKTLETIFLSFTYTFFLNMCEMNKRLDYYRTKSFPLNDSFASKMSQKHFTILASSFL